MSVLYTVLVTVPTCALNVVGAKHLYQSYYKRKLEADKKKKIKEENLLIEKQKEAEGLKEAQKQSFLKFLQRKEKIAEKQTEWCQKTLEIMEYEVRDVGLTIYLATDYIKAHHPSWTVKIEDWISPIQREKAGNVIK